eukprot:gene8576-6170_t
MDQKIQTLVHGAEETLNTSGCVRVWTKRNQCYGVQELKNLQNEAATEYEALYAGYQNLLREHTKLLADLTSIVKESAAAEELQRQEAKTAEVPQAIPILSTAVKVHPVTL